MPDDARIFISYSTRDGAEAAAALRQQLEAEGFAIWQDIVALQGGRDWWSQIEATLKSKTLQHFLLLVTPAALASRVVRDEIRLARQEGKTVCPIKGPDMPDLSTLPRWLDQIYDLDSAEHRTTLRRVLEDQSRVTRVPQMAPEPPSDFVERPREFDALKASLLDPDTQDAVAITAALRGAGGYGKTTLAKALAHDPDIQDAYFDGVLWGELGEEGGARVLPLISDFVALIAGEAPAVATLDGARTALAEALGDRRILMIVDDVWHKRDLEPFLQGGGNTTRLVTTRFDNELPADAVRQEVDGLQANEALDLIGAGLPEEERAANRPALNKLAAHLGEWPQLLKLANGFLRDRVTRNNRALADALADVRKRLDARGFTALDDRKAEDYDARHQSVAVMMNTSLELLDGDERAQFGELCVFPEDTDIPLGIVERLWREIGGLDVFDTEDLLRDCLDRSLLLNLDLDRRTCRLHDTVRHFLLDQAGDLEAQHARLLRALDGVAESESETDRRYFYEHRPDHLAAAGDRVGLDALLLDPGWLKAKLGTTGNPLALVGDYDRHAATEAHSLIGRTLRLTMGICARDPRQLVPQLHGRLLRSTAVLQTGFLDRLHRELPSPALIATHPSLTPPGAETARLEGHDGDIAMLALLSDGRLASASSDNTIRIWSTESGAEITRLLGHNRPVTGIAILAGGRLASGSLDNTVRIWDTESGTEIGRFEMRDGGVTAIVALPDGRIATGSSNGTILLWDPDSGAETAYIEGHGSDVTALAVLPKACLASGSYDRIRVWDTNSGTEISHLWTQNRGVTALMALQDGRLALGSYDGTIRLWDTESRTSDVLFRGHTRAVWALAVQSNKCLASGSDDSTIRLWDTVSETEIARIEGHDGGVTALASLRDGRLASGSDDSTVRLWDTDIGTETNRLARHDSGISALAALPHGQIASASYDSTIRLWDTESGAEIGRLQGHTSAVLTLAVVQGGCLASGSDDKTIRIWNLDSCAETTCIKGFDSEITALALLQDGRLASGYYDGTILLWDTGSGDEIARIEGHDSEVTALAVLPNGRLVSGSDDSTVRIWDPQSGVETSRFNGHYDWVRALTVLSDGRLVSGSDDNTIRVWDPDSSAEIGRLEEQQDWVLALAVPRGDRLVAGYLNNMIRLWDIETGDELSRLEVDAAIHCLTIIPDGRIVAGDSLGRLHWLQIHE